MKFGLVGYGKWGKILEKSLLDFGDLVFISNTKKTYKINKKIDFCFVATDDHNHYKVVKYFLKKKIPVFCEKPLCRNISQSKELILLSKKLKTPLFIDHVEMFKKKSFIVKKINIIERKKKTNDNIKDVLWKLCYHDLYLLYNYINTKKIIVKLLNKSKTQIKFKIINKNKDYIFMYDLNYPKRIHRINQTSFISKKNYLKKMISDVIRHKVNYIKNNKQAIFCIKTIIKINNKIF